jgi:hypothetical protein
VAGAAPAAAGCCTLVGCPEGLGLMELRWVLRGEIGALVSDTVKFWKRESTATRVLVPQSSSVPRACCTLSTCGKDSSIMLCS